MLRVGLLDACENDLYIFYFFLSWLLTAKLLKKIENLYDDDDELRSEEDGVCLLTFLDFYLCLLECLLAERDDSDEEFELDDDRLLFLYFRLFIKRNNYYLLLP